MLIDKAMPLIVILLAWVVIWRWREIRVALRLPGSAPKTATDVALGLAQIVLPVGWKQTDSLAANAALQAINPFRGHYLIVLSEPLEDFETHVGLLEYTEQVMSRRLRWQDVMELTGPVECAVASWQALQYEYNTRRRGVRITHLVTILQGARAFHQVDCWSLTSAFDRPAFDEVLDGFEERPGPIPERRVRPSACDPLEPSSNYTIH